MNTVETLRALRDEIAANSAKNWHVQWSAAQKDWASRLSAVLAELAGAEPVAWIWDDSLGGPHVTTSEEHANELREDGTEMTPLYTHAPPAPSEAECRERFEAWQRDRAMMEQWQLQQDEDGDYENRYVNLEWRAYRAAMRPGAKGEGA